MKYEGTFDKMHTQILEFRTSFRSGSVVVRTKLGYKIAHIIRLVINRLDVDCGDSKSIEEYCAMVL